MRCDMRGTPHEKLLVHTDVCKNHVNGLFSITCVQVMQLQPDILSVVSAAVAVADGVGKAVAAYTGVPVVGPSSQQRMPPGAAHKRQHGVQDEPPRQNQAFQMQAV